MDYENVIPIFEIFEKMLLSKHLDQEYATMGSMNWIAKFMDKFLYPDVAIEKPKISWNRQLNLKMSPACKLSFVLDAMALKRQSFLQSSRIKALHSTVL